MSVSIGVFTATAMFLAIGGDTEAGMRPDSWKAADCAFLTASGRMLRRSARREWSGNCPVLLVVG